MIRHAAAVAIVLCLTPAWLSAQSTEFTVSTGSANVYKSPSTGSPVIGQAQRGAVLKVTRELGSWVRVSWPEAEDGSAYVHVSAGSITHGSANGSTPSATRAAAPAAAKSAAPERGLPAPASLQTRPGGPGNRAAAMPGGYVAPPTHNVGFGAQMGASSLGFGASARIWSRDRLGFQLEVSHYALDSAVAPGRLTSIQIAPSVLWSLRDRMTDYVWLRPYVGAGASLHRQTLNDVTAVAADSTSETRPGARVFGGGEFTFASVPRFALSADFGYQWLRTPFAGFDVGGPGVAVAAHWYVK
jgi:hypothetical protein